MGLPFEILGKLYNVAAVFSHGEVLGLVPKSYLPNYNEFYEARHFVSGAELATEVVLPDGSSVPADKICFFVCEQMPKLRMVWNCVRICGHRIRRVSPCTGRGVCSGEFVGFE